jgi:ATP-binding cassette subfamily B multidrug efflux pump
LASESTTVFQRFERLVSPYPAALPPPPPRAFFAFLWENARGLRGCLLLVTIFTAGIGAFEALLFSMMAHVIDLLATVKPAQLFMQHGRTLYILAWVLGFSVLLAGLQAAFKYQAVFSNFPMRLRWNFHRLMLQQSLGFYQASSPGASPPR